MEKLKNPSHGWNNTKALPHYEADDIAKELIKSLQDLPGVQAIEVAGSLRRSKETIGDIDILIGAEKNHIETIFDAFTS